MGGEDHAAPETPPQDDGQNTSLHRRLVKALVGWTPWGMNRRFTARHEAAENRLNAIEKVIRKIQDELSEIRDLRLTPLEKRIDGLEETTAAVTEEFGRLRDGVIPAAVSRTDVMVNRLAEELEETASLVERILSSEPLPVAKVGSGSELRIAKALAAVQPELLEAFRGESGEIRHRLDVYLDDLRSAAPVLDLGCGRGELLLMLREAGVEASGIEGDPALAAAAVRRGLRVVEGDVAAVLNEVEDSSVGAVTAIHLFEHLPAEVLAEVLAAIHRVLRPGGIVIIECPNPHSLRVGGSLFWLDPTHARPLLPETLGVFVQAAGLRIVKKELLHPFPAEQLFADDEGGTGAVLDADLMALAERVDRLRSRLDEVINGPRDFAVWATKDES